MDSSDGLNVGDVTGPRWAGGTRNPETMPEADATPDEAFDLGTVAGYDEGYQAGRASREADVTEALNVGHVVGHASRNAEVGVLREQLAAAEAAKAAAWDEGARYVTHDSTYTEMFDIPKNPYRRTGDTNA